MEVGGIAGREAQRPQELTDEGERVHSLANLLSSSHTIMCSSATSKL